MLCDIAKSIGSSSGKVQYLNIDGIAPNPAQPRRAFSHSQIDELAQSIRAYGVIQPITVRKVGSGYELVAGERRLRASKAAGLTKIPAIIVSANDETSALMALVENLLRQDLSFFEEAEAIHKLIDNFGLTQDEVARRLCKRQSTIANKLRILRLTPEARKIIEENGLTERHARAVLRLTTDDSRMKALLYMARKGMNVASAEEYVERLVDDMDKEKPKRVLLLNDVRIFINTINHALDVMRDAGIPADAYKNETKSHIEYIIKIPKTQQTFNKISQSHP